MRAHALCMSLLFGAAGLGPVALVAAESLTPVSAQAALALPAEVLLVHGFTDGEGRDKQLDSLEALRKPPFDTYKKLALLKKLAVRLEQGKDADVELPNGRKLRLVLLERQKDGRLRVSVSINRPGQRDYLPVMTVAAAPGDPFFVAGQKLEGGTLIIGVRVGTGPR